MIDGIARWWRKRQRNIDLEILWPVCKREAQNINLARACFRVHCIMDPAWYKDFDLLQIEHMVGKLR